MEQQQIRSVKKEAAVPMLAEESINDNLSARPHDLPGADEEALEYGDMNLADAQASGYTDANGRAFEMSAKDEVGSPTGAYTDIGAGRSSAVVSKKKYNRETQTK